MKKSLRILLIVISLIMVFGMSNGFSSEQYPNRPITIVEGWGPGGSFDGCVRILSKYAEKELGQPIIVEIKSGATGTIAKAYVCKSKPNGYTIGATAPATFILQPNMRKISYNPFTDVTEIMVYCKYAYGISVRSDSPWNSIEDVIEYAKRNPGKIKYSTTGIGVWQHLTMERIAMKEGIKWTCVPFKTSPEVVTSVLGGHVDISTAGGIDIIPQVKAGKLKLLLSLDDSRWVEFPNVPAIMEKGYDFCIQSHNSIYGPAGMAEPIRQKLEDAYKKAMEHPDVDLRKMFGVEEVFLSGKEYAKLWRSQYDGIGKVIRALGLEEK